MGEHFQEEMNSCLLMLLHPNTDLIATVSPNCIFDFGSLQHAMKNPVGLEDEMQGEDSGPPPPKGLARFNTTFFADHKDGSHPGASQTSLSVGQRLARTWSNLNSPAPAGPKAPPAHSD